MVSEGVNGQFAAEQIADASGIGDGAVGAGIEAAKDDFSLRCGRADGGSRVA